VQSIGEAFATNAVPNGPAARCVTTYTIEPPTLPWQRLFEIAITPTIETSSQTPIA
jgi:hypothetical protein